MPAARLNAGLRKKARRTKRIITKSFDGKATLWVDLPQLEEVLAPAPGRSSISNQSLYTLLRGTMCITAGVTRVRDDNHKPITPELNLKLSWRKSVSICFMSKCKRKFKKNPGKRRIGSNIG
jgi:hypothetical protein